MAARLSILLRGLLNAFNCQQSLAKAWEPIAQKVLQKEGVVYNCS